MRMNRLYLCIATLLAVTCETGFAQFGSSREWKTELRLEGHCAKIFGRSNITLLDRFTQNPIAPIIYEDRSTATCTVTLKYTDSQTGQPLSDLSVEASRLMSTDHYGTKVAKVATVKTDKKGVARLKFRWDEKSCGVDLRIFDPNDSAQTNLTWPITLLTRDAFFQINKCQGTFISQGLSRQDICNGEPTNQ
jgi:hypothetical protein